ncbi:hypothetical protein ACROYT_G020805 [Oculina patagonica]
MDLFNICIRNPSHNDLGWETEECYYDRQLSMQQNQQNIKKPREDWYRESRPMRLRDSCTHPLLLAGQWSVYRKIGVSRDLL